ncbi:unnamed protein product, partial [Mesorhabditis belari]|uniref:Dynein heavy chain, cytoplasmic n=1 Tax=Mesorhabditis belari TaxID=2138241 RepID=A0AAF3FJ82_9BILA
MDSGNESSAAMQPPLNVTTVKREDLIEYIQSTAASLFGAKKGHDELSMILQASDAIDRFIADAKTNVLVIERSFYKEVTDAEGESEQGEDSVMFSVRNDVLFRNERSTSIIYIRRGTVIEAEKPISDQTQVLVLSDGSPYETLWAIIGKAVTPYFKSFIRESGRGDRDGDKLAPAVEKNLNEAEVALLHLQQNIDIPEINLIINPHIQQAIQLAIDQGRRAKIEDLGNLIEDTDFLNALQSGVGRWIKEIQKVTKLERDPASGSSLQEMNFWLNLERALQKIQQKRESDEVQFTLEALKAGKRFHALVSFDSDTGLKPAITQVTDYNLLMKEMPLNEIVSATDLIALRDAIGNVFTHLKKLRSTKYPIGRALRFLEAISRDLNTQMIKILSTRRLMHISIKEFDHIIKEVFEVFAKWDDEYDRLIALMRDLSKKKRDENTKLSFKTNPVHKKFEHRMTNINTFRRQHDQFRSVIERVLCRRQKLSEGLLQGKSAALELKDSTAIELIDRAYDYVKEADCLDVSPEGNASWDAARNRYEEQVKRVENDITACLRDQLGAAKNAKEMFSIFSRYNALFVRPHIRGAIRAYQTQLIDKVKENITELQEIFAAKKNDQRRHDQLTSLLDIQPLSARITFVRNIENKLNDSMKKVEYVLGKGWENHVEGQQLKKESDNFRKKLDVQPMLDEWIKHMHEKTISASARLFLVEKRSKDGKPLSILKVNFREDMIQLHKEVRFLKNILQRVNIKIVNAAHQAYQINPYAVVLNESIRTFYYVETQLAERKDLELLIASSRKEVQSILLEGAQLSWESYKLEPYVTKIHQAVNKYSEKCEELMDIITKIDGALAALDSCPCTNETIAEQLKMIQENVDMLLLGSYSNLQKWVDDLDKNIEAKLGKRAQEAIRLWALVYSESEEIDDYKEQNIQLPHVHPVFIEIRLTAQTIYVSPSIEQARARLLEQLFDWQSIVTLQPRVSSTRFQLAMNSDTLEKTYKDVLSALPGGLSVLELAYSTVDAIMKKVEDYVGEWLRYQALWDLQAEVLYDALGSDLPKWMKTLVEIRKSRGTFDTTETQKRIFPVIIDYVKVQSKVTLKYDYWHKEVLQKFGNALGQEMQTFFGNISKWRGELENQSVDSGSTNDSVQLITYVQMLKKQTKSGQEHVDQFRNAQRLLSQQRFQFPNQWLYAEHVDGEWGALQDILMRKDSSIQNQVANLQSKIKEEDELVEKRTVETLQDWERSRPIEGGQRPADALTLLTNFEQRMGKLQEDRDKMKKARLALDMTENTGVPAEADRLVVAVEELNDLKGVWEALKPLYTEVDEMKDKTWLSVQPRKLRQSLDELSQKLKGLPVKYKTYKSYESAKELMQNYSKMNMLITELKSEALKERHWRLLMKELHVNWNLQDLTLGQVWDADIQRHENAIKQILLVAQGELALEEFLKQLREFWQTYEVELINYQNKTRLIKGWDELFNKLKEHQNSLAAMKLSPYYKQFEEDALAWEDKLNRISAMFDVWIDVQRRWVYLEGLFSGSAEISTLLPNESARFSSISSEFLALMKKVTAAPRILDVVMMQGAQRLLERLAEMLAKIQKALGEYLERERSSFPRFYFVGDEDLLEIMGNSKDISRLQKHLKKMFAGVTSVDLTEEDKKIIAMTSREGETVALSTPVFTQGIRINDWLRSFETEMRGTLAKNLAAALKDFSKFDIESVTHDQYMEWLDKYPCQVIGLVAEIWWSNKMENAFTQGKDPSEVEAAVSKTLALLADNVLKEQPAIRRRKIEMLITEFVHKRDISRQLIKKGTKSATDFEWLQVMRFYFDPNQSDAEKCCIVRMANACFFYGFEYLGIQERLVRTPLTDRCYLTMTQALHSRLGGSPFGPAGTGKTESVKALGHQLGRFVLVFNCDETFDFQAMGRILVGLCQVGAWGCFDEFNRLEERMLSAVSQQIQTIQEAVRAGGEMSIDLVGKRLNVNSNIGIFITMNPGYSGRSNLPDNLKQLFRSLAMTQPDRQLIAQVMLFSQGFRTAEVLANKIVPLFILCKEQLSAQCHYDFGLRALKYVLVSAGNVKRDKLAKMGSAALEDVAEQQMLIQSVCETMVPKLVSEDITLLFSLLSDVFPSIQYTPNQMLELRNQISTVCGEQLLCHSDIDGELGSTWVNKVLQLYQITNLNHGLMLVGPSGSGKTAAWKVLLKALERLEKVEGVSHVIDAKAMSKDFLYGWMDQNTREWTDGLFTAIVRRIIDNVRGELDKRQWIIFDGDVDPEWVENLNSVLDDNKLLTLPNGERLAIPPNVRIIFEVADLKYATLATVSRCGMVWFSEEVVNNDMLFSHFLQRMRNVSIENEVTGFDQIHIVKEDHPSRSMKIQRIAADALQQHFNSGGLVPLALQFALADCDHIMLATTQRLLSSFFAMMNYSVRSLIQTDAMNTEFPISVDQIESYVTRSMLANLVWAFTGDGKLVNREALSDFIRKSTTLPLPPNTQLPLIDYEVTPTEWRPWSAKVPKMEIEAHRVAAADLVVPTIDTVRHEMLLSAWLSEHKPLVLCGPPGSGKTMTLLAALRSQQDMDVVNVNFSSSTTPELLMRTFDHYCEYRRTPNGVVLSPIQLSRWLVIFCDEINLPAPDKYGTQRVISFLRQLVELNGFYRTSDHSWVSLERIQFVGACNPPTDPGRHPMSLRFLRHVPVVYVDYPGKLSLEQIYGTFNNAMLKLAPSVRAMADSLTSAMVEVYLTSQKEFTQDAQPHYVYSPRELTRWVRGISEAIAPLDSIQGEDLVRLWAHEALRLFQDRLVTDEERTWTDNLIDSTAEKYFGGNVNVKKALQRPILYSCWLSKHYLPVSRDELRDYVKARLKGFYEEELDVKLVLFDQMLDHVLRIDRIYRQPQGHLLLIGTSGSGKTTLSRFVAWINGLSVFQLKVHSKYTAADFDEDMRQVLRRAGCRNEKMCFIMDESNMLDTGFLERLNTLLANGEVPGLFEGDEHTTLMTQIKEGAARQGLMLDTHDELYKWFTAQVMRNLHVVFTMNPSENGLRDRASTSPALFNRCVLNWAGDWAETALFQVGAELTNGLDMDRTDYEPPFAFDAVGDIVPQPPQYRHAIVNTLVHVHKTVQKLNSTESKRGHRTMAVTPRHFLDCIRHFTNLFHEKRHELEEEKIHLNIGLNKIRETEEQVKDLQKSLTEKSRELEEKKTAANAKLKQMLADQQKAEEEKRLSEQLQKELVEQLGQIAVKKETVEADLSKVEPAVKDAQLAVQGIQKPQLVELRSMASPPTLVKISLEAMMIMLHENVGTDWKAIRAVMVRDDFMSRILNYDADQVTPELIKAIDKYINNPDWEFEKVNRASQACGPMVKWARAQLLYSEMLHKVGPLRNELKRLESDAERKTKEGEEVKTRIGQLEQSIGAYKDEYAQLIGQAENIKADLAAVQIKVERSQQLLSSLGSERHRWTGSCDGFSQQMDTLIGDAMITGAYLSYSGYFDQHFRDLLFSKWSEHAQKAGIKFRSDLARIEYLSSVDERLNWNRNGLPVDDLCSENAIMLHRFNRYPLIIDPSGQSIDFVMKQFEGKNIQKTSFLDEGFRKNLESALRFGNSLLVQDVESYDPILNPVLNREIKRAGGRILITIGDQDIDLSPSFQIFLFTRDPSVEFPPDVCSRVTFVNFTVTSSSLSSQCLNQVLRSERPDVDKKRSDLLKLQGEFAVRLRQLEKALLTALNESKGKILDDNSVIATLENLKTEANEVQKKAAETDKVMAEVETVSNQYARLASACSQIYHTLQQLNEVHFLYQFSLDFLMDIFTTTLKTAELQSLQDYTQRLHLITQTLFETVFGRVSCGMLHADKSMLALLLLRIFVKTGGETAYDMQWNHLLGRNELFAQAKTNEKKPSGLEFLNADQISTIIKLTKVSSFEKIFEKIASKKEDVKKWIDAEHAENDVPELWDQPEKALTSLGTALYRLLVIHALRPDRLLASVHHLIEAEFGASFMQQDRVIDLGNLVANEVDASHPLLLCSTVGYDASGKVEDLALNSNKDVVSIAIGSAEGFSQADNALTSASKTGRWILLKNVHLAPTWLGQLEKRLHSLKAHPAFRLFLTAEIHPKLPSSANLLRSLSTLPPARISKLPSERSRLYLLICWLHALVQERLRYTPLGWANAYEFSDADLRVAFDTLDSAIDTIAQGRTNVAPEKLPWSTLRTLLSQCIYGGKIDNQFDQALLDCLLNKLFTPKAFNADYKLIERFQQENPLLMPEVTTKDSLLKWVESLGQQQLPSWLGLPNNADKVLLTLRGKAMLRNLLRVTDDEFAVGMSTQEDKVVKPSWMETLKATTAKWLDNLPKEIIRMKRTKDNIRDPLFRFFEREVNLGAQLVQDMRRDLQELLLVCVGERKQSNETRTLASSLQRGQVPTDWLRYTVPRDVIVGDWVEDFFNRIKQLQQIAASQSLKRETIWLGGLFSPEAYVTATRQQVAQANTWSLEQLHLHVTFGDADGFSINGMGLRGADPAGTSSLKLSDSERSSIPRVVFSWKQEAATGIRIPLYLYGDRKHLIVAASFGTNQNDVFYERGVALVANNAFS